MIEEHKILGELLNKTMDTYLECLDAVEYYNSDEGEGLPELHHNDKGTPIFNNGYPSLELARKVDSFLKTYGQHETNSKVVAIKEKFFPYLILLQEANRDLETTGFISTVLSRYPNVVPQSDTERKTKLDYDKVTQEMLEFGGISL
jgi:hypothetical protein